MKIYLFRHGETAWNKERRLQGQSDIPLNEFGRELAMKTAEVLKEIPFDRAFASPLSRAAETARIIMGERDIPFMTDKRLMEMHFGSYEGDAFDPPKVDPAHPLYNFLCSLSCCFFRNFTVRGFCYNCCCHLSNRIFLTFIARSKSCCRYRRYCHYPHK